MINYSKYSTTQNINSSGVNTSHSYASNMNSSMNYGGPQGSYSMKRQSSNNRQEQSVERLKSCIADLKKLASNKVKRQNQTQQEASFGNQTYQNEGMYESRRERGLSAQQRQSKGKPIIQQPVYQGPDKKNQQTKIASVLKKYINEIEQTTAVNTSNTYYKYENQGYKCSDRKDSHRQRSASNRKKGKHQRDESQTKKESSGYGPKRQNSKQSLNSSKKQLENSLRGAKNDSYSKQPPRKAQSQERIHNTYSDRMQANYFYHSNLQSKQQSHQKPGRSSSHYMQRVGSSDKTSYSNQYFGMNQNAPAQSSSSNSKNHQIQSKYTSSNTTQQMAKDRKPFTYNNYVLNQGEVPGVTNKAPEPNPNYSGYLNQSNGSGIDIRINNQNENYSLIHSPPKADSRKSTDIYSQKTHQSNHRKQDSTGSDNLVIYSSSQQDKSQHPGARVETSHFGVHPSDLKKTDSDQYLARQQQSRLREEFKQKSSEKAFSQPHDYISSGKILQNHMINQNQQLHYVERKEKAGGVKSLQEAANCTQSTDLSDNRVQSLDKKKIMSIQSNAPVNLQPAQSSSIYSIQQATTQVGGALNQNTTTSLSLVHNNMTYGGIGHLMRTHCGREDFNIEDLHCQIVNKIQRQKNLLKEIEGAGDFGIASGGVEFLDEGEFNSGKKTHNQKRPYQQPTGGRSSSQKRKDYAGYQTASLLIFQEEEVLQGDGCTRRAINFGKKA